MLGIRSFFRIAAPIVRASSAALVTTGLTSAIAAAQKQKLRFWVPFSVGATGGIRLQLVVPAGGVAFVTSIKLFNTVAPSITSAVQLASAVFTNAVANAGNHWLEVEAYIENGTNAGNVDLQIGQNTSDALTLTILAGGSLDVVTG